MKRKRQYLKRKHIVVPDSNGSITTVWIQGYAKDIKKISIFAERVN